MPIMPRKMVFDYSTNNGITSFEQDGVAFEIKFSPAGATEIHAYNDPAGIDAIALADTAKAITDITDAARFDFSNRARTVLVGGILVLRREDGKYALLQIDRISHPKEVAFTYAVRSDGGRDFSDRRDLDIGGSTFPGYALLTGAGFSKNWGGFLANEVWEQIYGNNLVQRRPKLKEYLLTEGSFEVALEEVKSGTFQDEDLTAMEAAIAEAFDLMDRRYMDPNPPVSNYAANDLLGRFYRGLAGVGTGFVFTLNQDLLLERIFGSNVTKPPFNIPGVSWNSPPPRAPMGANDIPLARPENPYVSAPIVASNFNLVKLHGSINWRSTDGKSSMVMGRKKSLLISESPLLSWYNQLFERVLNSGNLRLMVIGYGWQDGHINEMIAHAVAHCGLQFYSWNRSNPKDVLPTAPNGRAILRGMFGHTSAPMSEVMPGTAVASTSPQYDQIIERFFGGSSSGVWTPSASGAVPPPASAAAPPPTPPAASTAVVEPFFGRAALDGPGKFRARGEVLGTIDVFPKPPTLITLRDGPVIWFRLMPTVDPGKTWSVADLEMAVRSNFIGPVYHDPPCNYLRGPDGYGTVMRFPNDEDAVAVASVFQNGEIWSADTFALSVTSRAPDRMIPPLDKQFRTALHQYGKLMSALGIDAPYRWQAGAEDLKGRYLFDPVGNSPRPVGVCMLEMVEASGQYVSGESLGQSLRPFFVKLYEACGATRSPGIDQ